jgi:16S rRNA (adenine1518-N6/adenine1519-N6)-dimethyltransferase
MSLISKTNNIMKHFGFEFNKNLGQNFLIDQNILNKIVDGAELDEDSTVIEIGPGIGTLTQEMARHCRKVAAIELDDKLIPILNESLADFNNIEIINDDAAKIDYKKLIEDKNLSNVKVVANLPYYVTTPIIAKLFNDKPGITSIVVMIQKEVADRITSGPGTKEYGSITLLVQYYSKVQKICRVSPSCFVPRPRVESTVIRMDVLDTPAVHVDDEKLFFRVIRDSFNMRRKTLWNALKKIGPGEDKLKEAFEASNIDPIRRGETLSMQEFADLSNEILKRM